MIGMSMKRAVLSKTGLIRNLSLRTTSVNCYSYSTIQKQDSIATPPNEHLSLSGEAINPMHGSNHWSFERLISIASLGTVGAAFVYPHAMVDFILGFIVPVHCHIGFGAIITDYLPARKFPVIYRLSRGILYASTALTMYGLYKYNTEDVGIIEGIKAIWASKKIKITQDQDLSE